MKGCLTGTDGTVVADYLGFRASQCKQSSRKDMEQLSETPFVADRPCPKGKPYPTLHGSQKEVKCTRLPQGDVEPNLEVRLGGRPTKDNGELETYQEMKLMRHLNVTQLDGRDADTSDIHDS